MIVKCKYSTCIWENLPLYGIWGVSNVDRAMVILYEKMGILSGEDWVIGFKSIYCYDKCIKNNSLNIEELKNIKLNLII